MHAASELTVSKQKQQEGLSGPDRVQSTDQMGTKTGSLVRLVQVLHVHSIPPTKLYTQPDPQTSPDEFA